MKAPTIRWPIDLTHEKCGSDEHVGVMEISVEASGHLIVKCDCWRCDDEFVLKLSMIQLVAEAVVADKQTFGDLQDLPGTWTAYTKPN